MDKRTQLVIISPGDFSLPRGTPIRVRKIVEHLILSKDFDVTVFTVTDLSSYDVKVIRPVKSFIANIKLILKHYKNNGGQIFLCHTLTTGRYIVALKLLTRAKVVLEMHGFTAEEAYENNSINYVKYLVNRSIHRFVFFICDMVTTCSPTATNLIKKYNKETHTIFSGVDTDEFNPSVKPVYEFRRKDTDVIIGYAGNARYWQGIDFLLDAFRNLPPQLDGCRLVVLCSEIHNFEKSSNDRIEFLEKLPHKEMPGYLASCDILVIPRRFSVVNKLSIPSKVFEYLAMGKPVLASRTSDVFRVIVDGESGMLFEPGNTEDFYRCLEKLMNSHTRSFIGERAHERIRSMFAWDIQLSYMDKLLKNLAGNN
jgi:glycosyltransferase involved in cell wall biosynthesis